VAITATDASGNTATQSYDVDVPVSTSSSNYDANGNLIAQGTKTYEWDAVDRLTRVLDDGIEIARFAYDGNGRRAQKISGGVTRSYVYGGVDILEERSPAGTIRTVPGPGIDRPLASVDGSGAVSYYLADHLGSIVQQTNASAAVTMTRQYDPYGVPLQGATASGYAFTGREWDAEVGLYFYRARYYDPAIGRWLSADPVGLLGGTNLYTYVDGNPVSRLDPSGLSWKTFWAGAEKAVVAGVVGVAIALAAPEVAVGLGLIGTVGLIAGVASEYYRMAHDNLTVDEADEFAGAATVGLAGMLVGATAARIQTTSGASSCAVRGAGGIGPVLQGQRGVATAIAIIESEGGEVLGSEITIDAEGVRARPDLVVRNANGDLQFVEVKTGGGTLTPNQEIVYPLIERGGAVPAGANAAKAGLTPGVPLPPTPVRVIYLPGPGR
jgi:RHS repeat-associated protein